MPNTDAYLALGLVIVVGTVAGYALSLVVRFRQTRHTIHTLETLKNES